MTSRPRKAHWVAAIRGLVDHREEPRHLGANSCYLQESASQRGCAAKGPLKGPLPSTNCLLSRGMTNLGTPPCAIIRAGAGEVRTGAVHELELGCRACVSVLEDPFLAPCVYVHLRNRRT